MVVRLENSDRTAVSPNIVIINIKSLARFARKRKGCFYSSKWVQSFQDFPTHNLCFDKTAGLLWDSCCVATVLIKFRTHPQPKDAIPTSNWTVLRCKKGPGFVKEGIEASNGSTGKSWNLSALFQVCSFTPLIIIFKLLRIDWPNWMPQCAV